MSKGVGRLSKGDHQKEENNQSKEDWGEGRMSNE